MALLSRKKIVLDFSTDPAILEKIQQIKKKVRITMTIHMTAAKKIEIEIRGSKESIRDALARIRAILSA
ncbi:MAG: hypothetical protein JW839_05530 [Candidatus Lokiarchaeota archaeon]|nr:hypothetical protein [Candidatus Lokiarchaeota archaeon]